jgi:hypothetical protein
LEWGRGGCRGFWGEIAVALLERLIRGLTVVGGLLAIFLGWPIAEAARTDKRVAVKEALRTKTLNSPKRSNWSLPDTSACSSTTSPRLRRSLQRSGPTRVGEGIAA